MFTGRVVRVFPEQNYGIAEPFGVRARALGLREVILSKKDQRAIGEKGQIDPEKVRTTILEMGTIVKFLLDYRSDITPIAFLWAQKPKINTDKATVQTMSIGGKKPKSEAHNYPWHEQTGSSRSDVGVMPKGYNQKEKPIPEVTQISAPDSSNALSVDVEKRVLEVPRDIQQKTAAIVQSDKPVRSQPWFKVGRNDSNHSSNGPRRRVDGKRKVRKQKQHKKNPKYPTNGRDFRYLGKDIGATPMPNKAFQESISEVPVVPKKSQEVQNDDPLQVKKTDSVPISPKKRQESEKGFILPPWAAKKGVEAILGGQRVRIGTVGI